MRSDNLSILCISQKKSPKKYTTTLYQVDTLRLHLIIKMDTIFMKSKNSQTSKTYVLIFMFTDKLDLRRGENRIALSNFFSMCIFYTWKNKKLIQ